MTDTKWTLVGVRKLARQRWGKGADVRHNPKAMTPDQRAERAERVKVLRQEQAGLKAEQADLGETFRPLREAARFCVDVDAQEPSLSQLRATLERAERAADIRDRLADIDKELRSGNAWVQRYEAVVGVEISGLCAGGVIHKAGADTLDELAAKIQAT
jgi:hypothetical protein